MLGKIPATQLLLLAICQVLDIKCCCYTSELDRTERTQLVRAFTEDPTISSFSLLDLLVY
jgi:hypothetical protein